MSTQAVAPVPVKPLHRDTTEKMMASVVQRELACSSERRSRCKRNTFSLAWITGQHDKSTHAGQFPQANDPGVLEQVTRGSQPPLSDWHCANENIAVEQN